MKLACQLIRSAQTTWTKTRLGLLAAWVVLMICIVPIPSREHGQGWVQPQRMQGLYAPQTARLEAISKFPGDWIKPGDEIFKLNDDAAQLRRIDLDRQAQRAQVQAVSLVQQVKRNLPTDIDPRAAASSAKALLDQVQLAVSEVQKLSVKAELDGKLISLPAPKLHDIDGHTVQPAPQLWLDADQYGRVVPQGTMLAAIHSRHQLAVVPLSDAQLRDIAQGTQVRFYLPSHSDRVWNGTVQSIVRLEQLDSLARFVAVEASTVDANGDQMAGPGGASAGYAAVIELPMQDACIGAEVRAVFTVPARTLASRINDWLHSNVRWLVVN